MPTFGNLGLPSVAFSALILGTIETHSLVFLLCYTSFAEFFPRETLCPMNLQIALGKML